MKKIRVFIGSSIDELKLERSELMRFIQGLNNRYVDRGVFIEGYVCEETPASMRQGGSQAAHNDYIRSDADAAIFMFFHRAGQFTLEEMALARQAFIESGKPNIYVFFKAVDSAPDANEEIQNCVDRVFNEYGHYYKMFDDVDTVKLELLQFIVDSLPGGGELAVKDGRIYLNGEAVEGIAAANVFAYQNNPNLKQLKADCGRLLKEMTEASARGDADEALRVSVKLGEAQKAYRELEKDILGLIRLFHEENRKGRKADPRRMEALRLLELGRAAEAMALITQEELDRRAQSLEDRTRTEEEQRNDERRELIEDAKVRIQALKTDAENPDRFWGIERAYESVYGAAQAAKEYDFIYDYASFLAGQNNYPKAISVAEKLKYLYDDPDSKVADAKRARLLNLLGALYDDNNTLGKVEAVYLEALEIRRRLAETVSREAYEPAVAQTCNNLAKFYAENGRPKEAEALFLEALTVYRRLAETESREAYEPAIATTCNNLAVFYNNNGRPKEAEALYLKALKIRRRLAETVSREEYESAVADICNNLALYNADNGRPKEAEELYLEALKIRRRLAETVSREAYEPAVAQTCNNLAVFYADNGRPKEAEELYLEALEIIRRLAETVSREAYEPYVAVTCNNLADFYMNNGRRKEAEELLIEALKIYRRLAETVSREAYEPYVATTCNNLAAFYADNGRPKEAEELYLEALKIRRRLAETVSREAYEPYVAQTCNNLAAFYADNGKPQEAEKLYLEALKIRRRLAETVSQEAYEPYVAVTCNNLADFYMNNGRLKEAEELYLEALKIRRRLAETVSREAYEPYVAWTCYCIGTMYRFNNCPDLSEQYFSEALSIAKRYRDTNPYCRQLVEALS